MRVQNKILRDRKLKFTQKNTFFRIIQSKQMNKIILKKVKSFIIFTIKMFLLRIPFFISPQN